MSRQYSLGQEGEAAYTRLERSLRIGPDSVRALVASDAADVRYEVRRRVGEIVRVEVVRPGADVVTRIHAAREAAEAPVLVWIEAEPGVGPESEAWRQTYAALNMGRDVLAEKGGVSLVLAGPVALEPQVRMRAPDLVSMMRPMLVLGTRMDLVGDGHHADAREGAGDRQRDLLSRELADVLAATIHEADHAQMVARRAGVPPEHLPRFETAAVFWSAVVDRVFRGMGDPRRLIEQAARLYPGNAKLAELEKAIRSNDARADDLRVWLRRLAVAKYRNHVFAQLPVGTPKPLGLVWDAVVPLDFEEHEIYLGRHDGGGRPGLRALGVTIDLAALVARIDPVGDEPAGGSVILSPRRALAILGDPGSGKSTLCRWLAATIAEREPGRAPILVEAIDWMSREGSGSLVDAMTRVADGGSGAIDVADLRCLCEEGRIVLLVDGFDEPVRSNARARMREELEAFSAKHPKVALVVTSRAEGYLEAGLPAPWQAFVINPFDEGKLEDFVRRWYAMVEPRDPEARARGRAELMAALAAEPRARAMASNPLLATLIAELHHHRRAPLPGRRSELHELVVELLLVTRPAGRQRSFTEIDPDEQRVLLERFALWLQEQRSAEDGADIEFERDDFVRDVTRPRAGREGVSGRRAQRWLEWLVRETGLVREGRGGRYSFYHLSLMEYLAGRGVLNRFAESLDGLEVFVGHMSHQPQWVETLVLMLGSEATNQSVVSAGVRGVLSPGGGPGGMEKSVRLWLGLLLEDIDVSVQQRTALLSHVGMITLMADKELMQHFFDHVIIHSRRHGEAVRQWMLARIGEGGALFAAHAAAACPVRLRPEEALAGRADRDSVVPMFLDASPQDRGTWAEASLPRELLLKWAAEAHPRVSFSMALSRLAYPGPSGRAWTTSVLRRSEFRAFLPSGGVVSGYTAIRWVSNKMACVKAVMPAVFVGRTPSTAPRQVFGPERNGDSDWVRFRELAVKRLISLSHSMVGADELSALYSADLWRMLAASRESLLSADFPQRMLANLRLDDSRGPWRWQFARLPRRRRPNEVMVAIRDLAGDVHIENHAARLMVPDQLLPWELIRLRLDNLFIHDFFDGLASLALERGTEHDCLPLLLALGFAQYQTTWSWPHSRHWQQWFGSPPPADWLAAYFWHLCWAVGDVDRFPEHHAAAQACLDRADWPELAAELRAYTIRPMTVEEWQRNGESRPAGDPTPAPRA